MAVVNRNTSIEFIVKPKQDLYLEGSLRKLPRVTKGEAYPCQMQKNQNFSCLFRHYAKHNGLRKDDLIFSFVDELQPEQTPETVHLMPQDEIWVEHRSVKEEETAKDQANITNAFAEQFRCVLESGAHSDLTFIVGEEKIEILAHRAILSARSQYFQAMLKEESAMKESIDGIVRTEQQDPIIFRKMLEFIYTNTVRGLETSSPNEVIALLMLANEYLLDDLRKLCEKVATNIISIDNIGRLLLLSDGHNASCLREACGEFVRDNKLLLAQDADFRKEIEMNPELGLLLFESSLPKRAISEEAGSPGWMDTSSSGPVGNKRRRIADQNSENELDLVPPQLGTTSASTSVTTTAATTAAQAGLPTLPLQQASLSPPTDANYTSTI